MVARIVAALLSAATIASGAMAQDAETVTLTSRDGAIAITGTLVAHDGAFYRIDTVYGPLTLDASGVTCDGGACPDTQVADISISGAAAMGEVLLPALIESFAARAGLTAQRQAVDPAHLRYTLTGADGRAAIRFAIRLTTTGEGFADLVAEEADLILALRPARDEEVALAADAGLGDLRDPRRARVLALDALAPVVSADNPVRWIGLPQLAALFSGDLDGWAALGGPDRPAVLHLPAEGSGLAQAFEDLVMRPAGLPLAAEIVRHADEAALTAAVAADPAAIGIARTGRIGAADVLELRGACGTLTAADRVGVRTGDYPLTLPLFMYLPARRLPALARDFVAYAASPEAQRVVRRAGFGDQAPVTLPLDRQGGRLANAVLAAGSEVSLPVLQRMVRRLREGGRLTPTFRFGGGAAQLDARSRDNVLRLAKRLAAGEFDGRTLLFAGFSDGLGPAERNGALALERAEAVLEAVRAAADLPSDPVRLVAESFGEALPVACDDTEWGRRANRRVEVWVQ